MKLVSEILVKACCSATSVRHSQVQIWFLQTAVPKIKAERAGGCAAFLPLTLSCAYVLAAHRVIQYTRAHQRGLMLFHFVCVGLVCMPPLSRMRSLESIRRHRFLSPCRLSCYSSDHVITLPVSLSLSLSRTLHVRAYNRTEKRTPRAAAGM